MTPSNDSHTLSIHDTNDPGEARALMNSKYTQHRIRHINRGAKFAFKHVAASIPEGSFNILRYGSAVSIKPEPFKDFFMLEMPISGGVTLEPENGETVSSSVEKALLIGPELQFKSTWQQDCVQLMLKIDANQLHQRWQSIIGDPLAVLPSLLPQIDLTSPEGWRVKQLMFLLQQEMNCFALNQRNILATSTLGGATIDAVLSYILHHHAAELPNLANSILPSPLKHCVVFIQGNLLADLSIPVLLTIANVSERTLFNLFRNFLGTTPKVYVRSQRLKSSRSLLINHKTTVAEAARLSGFKHMGRFSSQYKAYFGESPSATQKR